MKIVIKWFMPDTPAVFCYRQVCAKHKPAGIAFTQWCSGQKWVFLPLAAKLLIGSKKVRGVQKWYGPSLSPCQVWWGLWVARRL